MKLLLVTALVLNSIQACKTPSKIDSGLSAGEGGEGAMCPDLDLNRMTDPTAKLRLRMFLEKMAVLGNDRARLLLASAESGMVVEAFYKSLNEKLAGELLTCGSSCSVVKEEMVKPAVEKTAASQVTGQAFEENTRPLEITKATGEAFFYTSTGKRKSLADEVREALNYKEKGSTVPKMTTQQVAKMFQDYVAATYDAEATSGFSAELQRARYVAMSNALEVLRGSAVISSAGAETLLVMRGIQDGMVSHVERVLTMERPGADEILKLKTWRAELARAFEGNVDALRATNIDRTIAEMEKGANSPEMKRLRELGREGLEKAVDLEAGRKKYFEVTGKELDRGAFERMKAR